MTLKRRLYYVHNWVKYYFSTFKLNYYWNKISYMQHKGWILEYKAIQNLRTVIPNWTIIGKFTLVNFHSNKFYIVFVFTNGIGSHIATKLESYGITVKGDRLSDSPLNIDSSSESDESDQDDYMLQSPTTTADLSTKNISNISKVNLDVSAMLAYCSSVTNGSAKLFDFDVPVLKQQAEWERLRPQKPILDAVFEGKTLYCCETAQDNFLNIVDTVGGSGEKVRARQLLNRLIVLPDDADFRKTESDHKSHEIFEKVQYSNEKILKPGGKIKERSLIIFTFGDQIQAVTVTANDGFVRAAKQQGIHFVVFIHESRALTEQKEKIRAIPLNK